MGEARTYVGHVLGGGRHKVVNGCIHGEGDPRLLSGSCGDHVVRLMRS